MLTAGFRMTIAVLFITVDVEVTAEWGVASSIVASAWSALQSHLLLLAHHLVTSSRVASADAVHARMRTGSALTQWICIPAVVALGVASMVVGYVGSTEHKALRYEFSGFAGGLVADEPPSYTLYGLGKDFLDLGLAGTSNDVAIWLISIGLFLRFFTDIPSPSILKHLLKGEGCAAE